MVATQTIPIVMAPAGAPVQSGFIDSLAHPGGNVTGLSGMDAELGGKRLQLLRDVIPNLARVAVLASSVSTDPFSRPFVDDIQAAATIAGIRLVPVLINGPNDFENAFAAAGRQNAGALLVSDDRFLGSHAERLAALAMSHRLPAIFTGSRFLAAGGLIGYGAVRGEIYPQIGAYVARILRGAKPADLPVVQASKFQLVINLKTAKTLSLTVPDHMLALADEVIE